MIRRAIATLAVAGLILALLTPAGAQEPSAELEQVRQQISAINDAIASARAQKTRVAEDLLAAEAAVVAALADLADAQAAVDAIRASIATERARLAELRERLDRLAKDLAATRNQISTTRRDLEAQAVELYMRSALALGPVILDFSSSTDLAVGLVYADNVVGHSDDLLRSYELLRREEERQQSEIEDHEAEVERTLEALEKDQDRLEAELARAEEARVNAEAELANARALLAQVERDIAAAEQHKAGLEADAKRLEAEIAARQTSEGESPGALGWPVNGPVSSTFGYRIHPIFGTKRFHYGIDISASYGAPIAAAAGGRVILAQGYGGYGNAVVIDHGGGLSTLYAHQSTMAVVVGQDVSRGQVIGYIGCSGYCTGPHLHFETRELGVPVDPMKYLGA